MVHDAVLVVFCFLDDLSTLMKNEMLARNASHPFLLADSESRMSLSEIATLLVVWHASHHKTFKHFFQDVVKVELRSEFPRLLSYSRCVEMIHHATALLEFALLVLCSFNLTNINLIDSSLLRACHKMRQFSHKVLRDFATWGYSPTRENVYGTKLHLVVNEHGHIVRFGLSQAHMADNDPVILDYMTKPLRGWLFGDKAYLSAELFRDLLERGLKVVTRIKSNMKNVLMIRDERKLLRQRGRIESVLNLLKNVCQIEHTRHRSAKNFICFLLAGLLAYELLLPNKPKMKIPVTFARRQANDRPISS
jgi:hypothetical protein